MDTCKTSKSLVGICTEQRNLPGSAKAPYCWSFSLNFASYMLQVEDSQVRESMCVCMRDNASVSVYER